MKQACDARELLGAAERNRTRHANRTPEGSISTHQIGIIISKRRERDVRESERRRPRPGLARPFADVARQGKRREVEDVRDWIILSPSRAREHFHCSHHFTRMTRRVDERENAIRNLLEERWRERLRAEQRGTRAVGSARGVTEETLQIGQLNAIKSDRNARGRRRRASSAELRRAQHEQRVPCSESHQRVGPARGRNHVRCSTPVGNQERESHFESSRQEK